MHRCNSRIFIRRIAAVVMAAFLLWSVENPLWAGSFHVSPIRIELSAQQASAALSIQNNGDDAVVIQAQTVMWSQESGHDQYLPSEDLLATPPIFTIAPGATQIVRIGMRHVIRGDQELSYRLFLQEVPQPPQPGVFGLQVALRISIPIFIAAKLKAVPILRWQLAQQDPHHIKVSLTNEGNAHVQITDVSLSRAGSAQMLAVQQVSAYLLPGQASMWLFSVDAEPAFNDAQVHVMANTDSGKMSTDAVLEKP